MNSALEVGLSLCGQSFYLGELRKCSARRDIFEDSRSGLEAHQRPFRLYRWRKAIVDLARDEWRQPALGSEVCRWYDRCHKRKVSRSESGPGLSCAGKVITYCKPELSLLFRGGD